MTDLERKLIETLRDQAAEVTPNQRAWAEHERRMRPRPRLRQRRVRPIVFAAAASCLALMSAFLLIGKAPGPVASPPDHIGGLP